MAVDSKAVAVAFALYVGASPSQIVWAVSVLAAASNVIKLSTLAFVIEEAQISTTYPTPERVPEGVRSSKTISVKGLVEVTLIPTSVVIFLSSALLTLPVLLSIVVPVGIQL